MSENNENKNVPEKNFKEKTTDFLKKVSDGVQKGAKAISDKTKSEGYIRRMKKYNPLFPDKFHSEEFAIPNMVEIVDDAVRRGIDVCEGSIGWISKKGGMEVLHLYDEWIDGSKLKFVPSASCDEIYYVDQFDRNRFIRVDCIFGKAHEERLAELERIACSLGAKSCSIEIVEDDSVTDVISDDIEQANKGKYKKVAVQSSEKTAKSLQSKNTRKISGKTITHFEGNLVPTEPTLKWFSNDDNIKGLIEMRCSGNNSIKSRTLILEGASSATMSQKTAYAIDSAIGEMKGKTAVALERQSIKEHHSKLVYEVEF